MAQSPPAAAPRSRRIDPDMGPAIFRNAPDSPGEIGSSESPLDTSSPVKSRATPTTACWLGSFRTNQS
jgi:hypothetical protein